MDEPLLWMDLGIDGIYPTRIASEEPVFVWRAIEKKMIGERQN
jgi:hypothetical protein